ncbi:peptidase, partial [bacterium]|nr:peptidase [bacterium]
MKRLALLLGYLGWTLLGMIGIGLLALIFLIATAVPDIPRVPDELSRLIDIPPTQVYAADGSLLTQVGGRNVVTYDRISPLYIKAVLAAEDDQFFHHPGVDKPALLRATLQYLTGNRSRGG